MTLAARAAEMWTMAMAEAGYPEVHAYPDAEVGYDDDPDNSVRFGYPDGYMPGTPRAEASHRAWALVRAALS